MEQLLLHLTGDYITQSDWMAQNKTKRFWPAFAHAVVYSLPFLLFGLCQSWTAFAVILGTHFLIDRYRLARFVVWAKNVLLHPLVCGFGIPPCDENCGQEVCEFNRTYAWSNCHDTGYPSERPAWLAVWLLIAADNTLHLVINYAALRWL